MFTQQSISQSYIKTFDSIIKHTSLTNDTELQIDRLLNDVIKNGSFIEAAKLSHIIFLHHYKNTKKYKKAIKYGLIEVDCYEKLGNLNKEYNQILYNIGWSYYRLEDFENAIKYHKKIIHHNYSKDRVAQSFCEIGRTYGRLGDFFKAEEYYLKGINILEELKKEKSLIGKYFGLVNVYINIDSETSLNKQLLFLKKIEALNLTDRQKLSLNNYYAVYYNKPKTFNFNKARYYYNRNLKASIKVKDSVFICVSYINLSDIYNQVENDSALHYVNKSLDYCKNNLEIAFYQKSWFYLIKDDLQKALFYIDKSIETVIETDSITGLPKVNDFSNVSDKFKLLTVLDKKAEILLKTYYKDGKINHIEEALKQLTLIDEFIDIIEQDASEKQSQLHWRKEASKAYSKAIECANILDRLDLAFYFNEKSKAILLTEAILANDISAVLPKEFSEKETIVKKKILKLESELKSNQNSVKKDSLFNLKFEFQKFSDSLKLSFPDYFSNKSKTQLHSLEDVKKQLEKNTIVISYNWNTAKNYNNVVYSHDLINGIVFTKNKTQTFSIRNASQINDQINQYRDLLSRPLETKKDSEAFKKVAYTLFKSLFPIEIEKELATKHLLIIPDGNLQNMPFEALITSENSADYLIKSNPVSYAYSMSFLLHNKSVTRETSQDFIGFAPVTFNYEGLSNLNQSETELHTIHDIIGGAQYLKTQANKSNFLKESAQSKIIHLATHALVSSDPYIAFSDASLKLHELYTHKTNADLVVLSACNTAVGEQFQGEGVFNLARGFFYAGANSVISSHWSVNDASTSNIMTAFYSNLKKGKSKSEALRQAQLTYINTHELSQASPYYWAPFVLVGDYNTPVIQTNFALYMVLTAVLLVLFLLIFRVWRKKANYSG